MSEAIDLVIQKLTGWLQQVILLLPNLVVATIVAVAFGLLSRVVRRLVTQGMNRVSSHRALNRLFATLASLVIAGIGVLLALTILDLSGVVFVDSAGIRTIDTAYKRLRESNRTLIVVAPPDSRAGWTFRIAGFSSDFVLGSVEAAAEFAARDV
jgi:hypothetical protein